MKPLPAQITCAVALLLAGISGACWMLGSFGAVEPRRPVALSGGEFEPIDVPDLPAETPAWPEPPAQSWDENALFEVFTPPLIYYDERKQTFELTPPIYRPEVFVPFGIELVAVRRERYRFQYEGSIEGPAGEPIVLLRDEETAAGLRGAAGQAFPEAGIRIVSFESERRLVEQAGSMPYVVESVDLVLYDEALGSEIRLTGDGPVFTPELEGVFRSAADPGRTWIRGTGESFSAAGSNYHVLALDPDSETATVEKRTSGEESVRVETLPAVPAPAAPSSPPANKPLAPGNPFSLPD